MSEQVELHGQVDPAFEPVRAAFAQNFARADDDREVGAAVAAFHQGRCVVDLWGGLADPATGRAWTRDTLANVWSTTKGVAALAVARLVGEGALTYRTRVASVWPAFAAEGKGEVTVAELLSHQAGLPGFAEPTSPQDLYDWDGCCAKLARQAPAWAPGTDTAYHAVTFGWLAGEVVRRVCGVSLGTFLDRELGGPLGADVHVGLPQALEGRVARMLPPRAAPAAIEVDPVAGAALQNPVQDPDAPNARAWRAAEMPSVNGQASAMGLARLYAMAAGGGVFEGRRLLAPQVIDEMIALAAPRGRRDRLMGLEDLWGMGFMLNPLGAFGPGGRAFGHCGWGGSFGCADPDLDLSMGYVCNQMGAALIVDPRSMALSGAIADCAARAGGGR